MFYFLLCVSVVIAAIILRWLNYINKFAKVPSPKAGHPLLRHYYLMKDRENGLKYGLEATKECGKTYKTYVGPFPTLITSDPKLLEKIMSATHTKKSPEYEFFKRWWGDGLLTSSGQKWKSHRKILTPAFHYNILENFVEVFEENGKRLIKNLHRHVDDDSVEILTTFSLYTLDVICETAMGTTIDAQTNPNHKYFKAVRELCDIGADRTVTILHRFEWIYQFSDEYRREIEHVTYVKDFSTKIIKSRRRALEENGHEYVEVDEFGKKKKTTFMDILLMSKIDGEKLSDEDVREEVDTFLFEGHDTTAIALSFIAYNLATNPEIQAKAYEEIVLVFGEDKNRMATIDDLQSLKYLEKVIKESLRLYPSVPMHARIVLEDVEYQDYVIPKGITILINQYTLHRDEETFPDPEKFDPERFDLSNQLRRDPYAYIPFSAGPRNCIGQKFAMLELKSAISKILRNFELVPSKPEFKPKLMATITLHSLNGVRVGIRNRM